MGAKNTRVEQAMEEARAMKDAIPSRMDKKLPRSKRRLSCNLWECVKQVKVHRVITRRVKARQVDRAGFVDFNDLSEVTSQSWSNEAEIWAKRVGSVS